MLLQVTTMVLYSTIFFALKLLMELPLILTTINESIIIGFYYRPPITYNHDTPD